MIFKLFLVLIVFTAYTKNIETARADEKVVFTQLLHRHGSRSPLPPVNESRWCSDRGCGLLSEEGKDMLFNLGKYLRVRYETLNPSFFPNEEYNPDTIHSQSTDIDRTILSAEAMLKGLYPNTSNPLTYLPLVSTVPKLTDVLLSSNAVMSYSQRLSYLMGSGRLRALMQPTLVSLFGDPETNSTSKALLETMAAEVSLEGLCEMIGYGVCLGYVQDITVSLSAEGKANVLAPTCAANEAALNEIVRQMNTFFYGYNLTTDGADGDILEDVKARGSCGQPLAQQMLSNIRSFIMGTLPFKVMHYSAHDTTVSPFGVTIGDPSLLFTPYAVVVIIDLIQNGSAYYVRGVTGSPEQVPGPHAYSIKPLRLGGVNSKGYTYFINNTEEKLPFDDFVRFIDCTKPASPMGYCYLSKTISSFMACGLEPKPSDRCVAYRTNCPEYACPVGSYLSFPNYNCVAFLKGKGGDEEGFFLKIEIISTTLIATVVVGVVIGYVIRTVVGKRRTVDRGDFEVVAQELCNSNFVENKV